MTFHDRRMIATRNVKNFRKRMLMKQGAMTINIWNSMPDIEFGSITDDWKAAGDDLRAAMIKHVEECG